MKMADMLMKSGDADISSVFLSQSFILEEINGQLQPASQNSSIMNEKFDIFAALKDQIAFNKSINMNTDYLEQGLEFLDKFKLSGSVPKINSFA